MPGALFEEVSGFEGGVMGGGYLGGRNGEGGFEGKWVFYWVLWWKMRLYLNLGILNWLSDSFSLHISFSITNPSTHHPKTPSQTYQQTEFKIPKTEKTKR